MTMWRSRPNIAQDTICHFCDKVFCCESCRDKHEINKHGRLEDKCPLCYNDKIQIKNLDDSKLLEHLVKHHFPLSCNLCGQIFTTADDLQAFQKCNWQCSSILEKDKSSLVQSLYTPSPIARYLNYGSDVKKTLSDRVMKINDCSKDDLKMNRYTSTPLPFNFLIKTPKTPHCAAKFDSLSNIKDSHCASDSMPDQESKYLSNIEIVDKENESEEISSNCNKSHWKSCREDDASLYSTGNVVEENENFDKVEEHSSEHESKEVTESKNDSYEKCHVMSAVSAQNTCENETSDKIKDCKSQESEEKKENSESQNNADIVNMKNQSNITSEQSHESNHENKNMEFPIQIQQFGETTRMTMMVIIENRSTSSGFCSEDLKPLLESGLKKLEQVVTLSKENNSNIQISSLESKPTNKPEEHETVITNVKKFNYMQVSEFKTPAKRSRKPEVHTSDVDSSETHYGFLSSMTRALMNAFKKIPEKISLRSLSRPTMLALPPSPLQERNINTESTRSSAKENNKLATPLKSRKRRHEDMDYSTQKSEMHLSNTDNDVFLTPRAKKYRGGWSKIKGRPPIGRLRRAIAESEKTRVSSSTQCFKQGSLSVGNRIIPLPSRAKEDNALN